MSYPIIFGPNGEPKVGSNAFQGLGYGTLTDCSDSIVTQQENGSYEYSFSYPITGALYDKIQKGYIVAVEPDETTRDRQRFRIDSITVPVKGLVEVHANHISYDLSGALLLPFEAQSATDLVSKLNDPSYRKDTEYTSAFSFTTEGGTKTDPDPIKSDGVVSIRSVLGGSGSGSLIDAFGGFLKFDNYEVRHVNNLGSDRGVAIRYGKNLIDGTQEESISETFDAVYPYWKGTTEDSSGESIDIYVYGSIITVSGEGNYTKLMPLDCSSEFQEQPTSGDLDSYAEKYIQEKHIGRPEISLNITYEQLRENIISYDLSIRVSPIIITLITRPGDTVEIYDGFRVTANGKVVGNNLLYKGRYPPPSASSYTGKYISYGGYYRIRSLTAQITGNLISFSVTETSGEFLIDPIQLGDIVHVYFQDAGIDTDTWSEARVTEYSYNTLTEKYDSITLGDPVKDLSTRLVDHQNQINESPEKVKSLFEQEVDYVSKKITGNLGGYVILHTGDNGKPDELLILDQESGGVISQASSHWRWNYSGLGFSKDQYGPDAEYTTALTNDGHIVLSKATIQGETITGSLITGVIQSATYSENDPPDVYSASGMKISLDGAGYIKTKNFAIGSDGTAYFKGDVEISGDDIVGGNLESLYYEGPTEQTNPYSVTGVHIDLETGEIITPGLYIDEYGNGQFKGDVQAANIKNWAGQSIGDSNYRLNTVYAENINVTSTITAASATATIGTVKVSSELQFVTGDTPNAKLDNRGVWLGTGSDPDQFISWTALVSGDNRTAVFG